MKAQNTSIMILLMLLVGLNSSAQDSYQTFNSAGFKVKSGCKLTVNSTFIQMAKQQGMKNILASYMCAENEESFDSGVIININIYDESKNYKSIQTSEYRSFEKRYLEQYKSGLGHSGIKYHTITYQGVTAIEYTFDQMGLPTRAIVFLKNKKSYLLQTSTRSNLATKFNALKSNFILL